MYIPICVFNTIDSTNTHAKNLIQNNLVGGNFALYSYCQTNGKGKFGAVWQSNKGNVHFTLALKKNLFIQQPQHLNLLSLATSLAVYNTVGQFTNHKVQIKWPNDILVNQAKLSGMLIEQQNDYLIIGIGINLFSKPTLPNYNTVYLAEISPYNLNSLSVCNILLQNLLNLYKLIKDSPNQIISKYIENMYLLNQTATIKLPSGTMQGKIVGINNNGCLLLQQNNTINTLSSAEIFV